MLGLGRKGWRIEEGGDVITNLDEGRVLKGGGGVEKGVGMVDELR